MPACGQLQVTSSKEVTPRVRNRPDCGSFLRWWRPTEWSRHSMHGPETRLSASLINPTSQRVIHISYVAITKKNKNNGECVLNAPVSHSLSPLCSFPPHGLLTVHSPGPPSRQPPPSTVTSYSRCSASVCWGSSSLYPSLLDARAHAGMALLVQN